MSEYTLKISYPKAAGVGGSKTMKVNENERVQSIIQQCLDKLKQVFFAGPLQVLMFIFILFFRFEKKNLKEKNFANILNANILGLLYFSGGNFDSLILLI